MKLSTKVITTILAVAAAFIGAASNAAPKRDKPIKVLAIGNSLSICVLKDMPKIAADLGCPLDICSMYIPGCTLDRHAANLKKPDDNAYRITWSYVSCEKGNEPFRSALATVKGKHGGKQSRSNIERMLKADKWDVVTIQQGSHKSWQEKSYEPHGTKLINMIKKCAPQAKIYVQQTWSYTPWDKRLRLWKMTPDEMYAKLEKAYDKFAKSHGLEIIPTGEAVQRYRKGLPVKYTEKSNNDVVGSADFKKLSKPSEWWPVGVEKETGLSWPSGDVFHFNWKGEYLQGLVWTAILFDVDVTKCNYSPKYLKIDSPQAVLMKKIANEMRKR